MVVDIKMAHNPCHGYFCHPPIKAEISSFVGSVFPNPRRFCDAAVTLDVTM